MKETIEISYKDYLVNGIYWKKSERIASFQTNWIKKDGKEITLSEQELFKIEMEVIYIYEQGLPDDSD